MVIIEVCLYNEDTNETFYEKIELSKVELMELGCKKAKDMYDVDRFTHIDASERIEFNIVH